MSKLRYKDLIDLGYPERKARAHLLGAALRCYGRADKKDAAFTEARDLLRNTTGTPEEFSTKEKMMMALWRFNDEIYRFIYRRIINCSE